MVTESKPALGSEAQLAAAAPGEQVRKGPGVFYSHRCSRVPPGDAASGGAAPHTKPPSAGARASRTSGATVIWLRCYCQPLCFISIYLTGIADYKCLGTTHVLQSLDGFQNNFKQFQTIRCDVQRNYGQLHQHVHLQLTLNL